MLYTNVSLLQASKAASEREQGAASETRYFYLRWLVTKGSRACCSIVLYLCLGNLFRVVIGMFEEAV